jgi:transcriptional antiterminator
MDEKTQVIYQALSQKYKKQALDKKELSQELGISVSTVNYYLAKGRSLPNYKKLSGENQGGNGGRILFPISEVAKYLAETSKLC